VVPGKWGGVAVRLLHLPGALADPRERSYFKNHIVEAIGNMTLDDVKPAHVRFILEEAAAKGLKHATVGEVRGVLHGEEERGGQLQLDQRRLLEGGELQADADL
jgi:hypothetical protein